jgi:uncharacterized protein YdeI (YjbR/CyaY-like superfamily)
MGNRDPRVDAYIAKSADYARPILKEMRALVHATCPEVTETLKWRNPSFEYQGLLCGMAAFKKHCAFGFWKHELVLGAEAISADAKSAEAKSADPKSKAAAGSFGTLKTVADLPSKAQFAAWMKTAMRLNEEGVSAPRKKSRPKTPVKTHPELKAALATNKKAAAVFEAFSPSARREYVEWIADAKTDATRERRIAQAVEWIAAGKRRNWKYERC